MAEKKDLYKRVKIAGLIAFIPVLLFSSLFGGYFAGEFLVRKMGLPFYVTYICIGMTLLAAIKEIIRIIRISLKIERES
ncbi:MAG: hypothetical protein KJ880_03200 [Candidatus Omnitrophica bacterium]|nr:hypothetical protein [Candidatus Omnitrophota bacterium]MBU1870071.1 hypothetical protein [Candidatus Omnitrophota bacterium]